MNNRIEWDIDNSMTPPMVWPADLDRSAMIDITCVGDLYRRYLDPKTGTTHDGAKYAAQMLAELPNIQ